MEILDNIIIKEISKWLMVSIAALIFAKAKKILKRLTLIEYKQIATDYALEKSLENGYADYRDSKLDELIESDKFINKKY